MSVTEFLSARIAEDEERASKLLANARRTRAMLAEHRKEILGRLVPGWALWPDVEDAAVRELTRITALRMVVEMHVQVPTPPSDFGDELADQCRQCRAIFPCPELQVIAALYQAHPDWREKW